MFKLARIILAILLAGGCASRVRADTVNQFTISGTAVSSCIDIFGMPILGCTPIIVGVAGALAVDVTTGTALAEAVLFDAGTSGIFGTIGTFSGDKPIERPTPDGVALLVHDVFDLDTYLELDFTTPTSGSLVGFDGNTISPWPNGHGGVFDVSSYSFPFFEILGGSITPVIPAPEPGSFVLILIGLRGLLVMCKRP
jgi:hypothetical protein